MTLLRGLVVVLALFVSVEASAQTYVMTTSTSTYVPLSGGTNLTFNSLDEGWATIPVGFNFPYYGKGYTSITVSTNGLAYFDIGTCTSGCSYLSNSPFGLATAPYGAIAPFWDDLELELPTAKVSYKNTTDANGAVLTIEWSEISYYSSSTTSTPHSLTFKAVLHENGNVELAYGNTVMGTQTLSGSMGVDGPTGNPFGKSCNSVAGFCKFTDIIPNEVLSFGPPPGADLFGSDLRIRSITGTTTLTVNTAITIRNFGLTAVTGVNYNLYLSSNTTFEDGTDTLITPTPIGNLAVPAQGQVSHNGSGTAAAPASGNWYVIAVIDPANTVVEASDLNNVIATPQNYAGGVDLAATTITGPSQSGPLAPTTVHVLYTNRGFSSSGAVPVKIVVSEDTAISPEDPVVFTATETLAGGKTTEKDVTFTMPDTLVDGTYRFILQLDDGPAVGTVVETSESNNIVSSGTFQYRKADLVLTTVQVKNATPPNGTAEVAFFGESIMLETTVSNVGGSPANNFSVSFYMSDNDALNAITSDPLVGEVTGITLNAGESQVVTITKLVPTKSLSGNTYPPADYWFFASATAQGSSDTISSGPRKVRGPAPDLVATSLEGPSAIASGESFVVTRTIRNQGLRPASAAPYRYYLSANPIVSEDDFIIPIVSGGELKPEGIVTLAAGASSSLTEVIKVPPQVPAATYYLGILVDPPGASGSGAVLETFESNNGLATQVISVVPQALAFQSNYLPDGIVGLPYEFWFSAKGAPGPYTFKHVVEGGPLPQGLTLGTNGRLSGVASAAATVAFTVRVDTPNSSASTRVVLKTVPLTASLTITSTSLPALVRGIPFDVFFSAQGGQAPYLWTLETGALPPGFNLNEGGRLNGATTAAVGTTYNFSVRVRDAVGNTSVRAYNLVVLDATALNIDTLTLLPGVIGQTYVTDIVARSVNGAEVPGPITWKVANGTVPPGITLTERGEILTLSGKPTFIGNFAFSIECTDGKGRSDTASYLLQVYATPAKITGDLPVTVSVGEEVNVKLALSTQSKARFSLFSGRLPPGLTLGAEGAVTGKVKEDAAAGRYNLSIAATAADGSGATNSYAMEVLGKEKKSGGCASTDPTALMSLWLLAPLALGLRRRTKRNGTA